MAPLSAWFGQLQQRSRNLGLFVAHAERRYARDASTQLLQLYQDETREHPQLSGRALYEAVLARRLNSEAGSAADIVRRAEDSFTEWPVHRALKFRDVVHYQIFSEFTHQGTVRQGTRTNIGAVVARIIPEEL